MQADVKSILTTGVSKNIIWYLYSFNGILDHRCSYKIGTLGHKGDMGSPGIRYSLTVI